MPHDFHEAAAPAVSDHRATGFFVIRNLVRLCNGSIRSRPNGAAPLRDILTGLANPTIGVFAVSQSAANPAPTVSPSRLDLFPPIEPFQKAWLPARQGHQVYYEQCGNPDGLPVLFLHGGPAGGFSPRHRQFFDPAKYRICLFDQRGCGQSSPHGEREANNTAALVGDIEALRESLGIRQWLVFGGSWGSALALAYASSCPQACLGLVLRGIFLTGTGDMEWFFERSAQLIPDAWQRFAGHVGQTSTAGLLAAYTHALEDVDSPAAQAAAGAWLAWEYALSSPGKSPPKPGEKVDASLARKYRLQASFLNRLCDLGEPAVLAAGAKVAHLPTVIVHGRLDWVCRPQNAWQLALKMAGSRLRLLADAAHDPFSPSMKDALVSATNLFATDGHFERWPADGNLHES